MKQNAIVVFLLAIFAISCSKEPEHIAPKPNADTVKTVWKSHPQVRLDKVFCELAYPTADKLYVLSNDYLLTFNAQHELISSQKFTNKGLASSNGRPFMNEQFFGYRMGANFNKIRIHLTQNPSIFTDIDIKTIDSAAFINPSFKSGTFAINTNGELIIPIRNPQPKQKFIIYKISQNNETINITFSAIATALGDKFYENATVSAFKEDFYVSASDEIYKIKSNGEINLCEQNIFDTTFLTLNDTVYMWGVESTNYKVAYTYQAPNQNTWKTFATGVGKASGIGFKYKNIDNKILMYQGGQIWQWNIDSKTNKYEIKTISTRGLEGQYPRDFFVFRDRVYYASFSGLFYKPLDKFFEYETK